MFSDFNPTRNFRRRLLSPLCILSLFLFSGCGSSDTQESNAQHLERAKAYQDQGQYKAAIIEYRNAIKKSGGAVEVVVSYADMLNDVGQYGSALDLLDQIDSGRTQPYYHELVEAYLGLNKYVSAESTVAEHMPADGKDARMLKARALSGLGDNVRARKLFQMLLDEQADNDAAMLGLAGLEAREGRLSEAEALIARIDPNSESYQRAQLLLSGIHVNQDDLEKAETVLSNLLSTLPNTDLMEPIKASTLERMSYVLTRLGRSNEAYIYTKLLAEAFPGANEVNEKYGRAVEQFQSGELGSARGILEEITAEYPNHNKAQQLLGIITYLQGDTEEASEILSESVDPEVANPLATHVYAATNLKLNDPKKVIEILEPGIERTEAVPTLALYGLAAISDQQFSKGERALNRALELEPDNVRVRLILADYYRNKPNPDSKKEKQQLDLAYGTAPNDRAVLQAMVGFLLRNESTPKAEGFVSAHLKKYPDSFASNLVAGYFYVMRQDLSKAKALFNKAVNVASEESDRQMALFSKGKAEIALSDYASAEKTFTEVIKQFPDQQLGYKGLYSIYLAQSNAEMAAERLETLARKTDTAAPYVVLIQASLANRDVSAAKGYLDVAETRGVDANLLDQLQTTIRYTEATQAMQTRDFDSAREHLASLLADQPENLRLLSFMVDLEIQAGKLTEAEKVLAQIESLDATHPVLPILKGDLARANNAVSEAIEHYRNAWNTTPSNVSADKLYQVLSAAGEQGARSDLLDTWLERFPDSVPGNLYQAMEYQQRGQRTKAAEGYEKLLDIEPNHVAALNNLGWIYFEKNDDRALGLLARAAELAPQSPAVLDSYGWVLFKNGKTKEGVGYLEKAHDLAPGNAEISAHLKEAKATL